MKLLYFSHKTWCDLCKWWIL